MQGSTTFVSRQAVDMWDAQFRWREGRLLRDVSIDDTWRRVVGAIAAAEGDDAGVWRRRFFDALRCWRALPDPSVLRCAGTDRPLPEQDICTATVNVLGFVSAAPEGTRLFDATGFRRACLLALRLADDQRCLWAGSNTIPAPRVGLMGLGEALLALDLHWSSPAAAGFCAQIAEMLALGCLRANLQLGSERGAIAPGYPRLPQVFSAPGVIRVTWEVLRRRTMRVPRATRLQPQSDLAMLANGTGGIGKPRPESPGSADAGDPANGLRTVLDAERRLRRAMQPWIDDPIDSPLIPATV